MSDYRPQLHAPFAPLFARYAVLEVGIWILQLLIALLSKLQGFIWWSNCLMYPNVKMMQVYSKQFQNLHHFDKKWPIQEAQVWVH